MFYENDLVARQIEALVQIASKILFGSNCVSYEKKGDVTDELYDHITSLIEEREFGTCEDLIYDNFDLSNDDYLILAIDYYHRLNAFDDDILEESDFERDEVRDGLMDFMRKCGIPDDAMAV
ncbi:MAG: hypothetical protein IJB57_05700 [Clostridia bacterium]|nr:hypothetical protein [Clostridia bacterium]